MADTPWDGFSDVAYLQATDILVGQRGAGGINFTADALLFKDANGRVGLGATAGSVARLIIQGTGQEVGNLTDAGSHDDSLYLRGTGVGVGSGGVLLLGTTYGNQTPFAALKGFVTDGGTNTSGDLVVALRAAVADTALTERARLTAPGRMGLGVSSNLMAKFHISGAGQNTGALTDAGARDDAIFIQSTSAGTGAGGAIYLGGISGVQKYFAAIKSYATSGSNNMSGDLIFSLRAATTDTALTERVRIEAAGHILPGADNTQNLGSGSKRMATIYAGTGTINTSDAREKKWRGGLNADELAAAREMAAELGVFQWLDAIAEKGEDGARHHFGVRAQQVWSIMAKHGLVDPIGKDGRPGETPYAFLCYDEWQDKLEPEKIRQVRVERTAVCIPYEGLFDAKGEPAVRWEYEEEEVEEEVETGNMVVIQPAGNRFGVRTDQLILFLIAGQEQEIAAQAARQEELDARLAALEAEAA